MHRFNFIHYIKFDKVLSGRHSLPFTPLASTQKLISLQTIIPFTWLLLWFRTACSALPQCRHLRNHFVSAKCGKSTWCMVCEAIHCVGVKNSSLPLLCAQTFQFAYDCRPLSAVWHSTPRLCLFISHDATSESDYFPSEKWVKQAQLAKECKTPGGHRPRHSKVEKCYFWNFNFCHQSIILSFLFNV